MFTYILIAVIALFAQNSFPALAKDVDLHPSPNRVENLINSLLNNGRAVVKEGIPALHIPPLDPLVLGGFHLSHWGFPGVLNVTGNVSKLVVDGISTFNVSDMKFTVFSPRLVAGFELKQIRLTGEYFLDGTITSAMPFKGNGPFTISANHIRAGVDMSFGLVSTVEKLALKLDVDSFTVKFDNLLGGGFMGTISNNLLGASMKTVFDAEVQPQLKRLSEKLKDRLNGMEY